MCIRLYHSLFSYFTPSDCFIPYLLTVRTGPLAFIILKQWKSNDWYLQARNTNNIMVCNDYFSAWKTFLKRVGFFLVSIPLTFLFRTMSRNYLSMNEELQMGDFLLSNNREYKAIFQVEFIFSSFAIWKITFYPVFVEI